MGYSAEQIAWIEKTRSMGGAKAASGGGSLAPAPSPSVPDSVGEQLRRAVQTFLGAFTELDASGAKWEVSFNGKVARLTQEERDKATDALAKKLLGTMEQGFGRVAWAEGLYAEQKKVDDEWWLTSHVVHVFGRVSDPGPLLAKAAARAKSCRGQAAGAAQSRDLEALAIAITDCLAAATEAELLSKAYFEGTIGAAEFQVKVLEGVVTASKYTLMALSVLASGGASASLAGAISGVASTTMDTVTDLGLGKKVDWASVTVSVIMEIVMLKYGDGLEHALKEEVAKRLVKEGAHVSEKIVTKVCTEMFKVAMANSAKAALKKLHGEEVTNAEVAKEAAHEFFSVNSVVVEVLKALREAAR